MHTTVRDDRTISNREPLATLNPRKAATSAKIMITVTIPKMVSARNPARSVTNANIVAPNQGTIKMGCGKNIFNDVIAGKGLIEVVKKFS
jgi:hypothetical protein